MEEIKAPKKESKFLKAIGKIGKSLVEELVMGIGRKFIDNVVNKIKFPNKNNTLSFLLLLSCTFAFAQYPATGNKQRLGYQTTGDGLVWRGRASDTVSLKSSTINNAYIIIDTVNNVMYNYIKTKGGWLFNNADTVIINNNFTQPVDSLFFKTSVSTNNVDTAKMRWDSDLGTVVLGMYDKVPNELGFKNFWLVKNQTGSTITKGSLVYASGTVGSSGRISVSKFIANGTIEPIYLLGITAHDLTDGEDGYVISYGKIRQVNTDTFSAGAILYPSPTTAGVWTDVEPVAPNIDLPIGFCVNSSSNNGTIAIRVASGFSLSELHDVAISSPSANASLYYSGGLWRDTTAALLVSDTASMLTNYLRSGVAASTYLPLTGGSLSGDLSINKSSDAVIRLAGNLSSYGKLIFSANNSSYYDYGASIESNGEGVGIDVGNLIFKTGYGTTRTTRMTLGGSGNLSIVNNATVGGTFGVTGVTTLSSQLNGTTGTFNIIGGNFNWTSNNFKIQPFNNYGSNIMGIEFNSTSSPESMDFYYPGYIETQRRAFRFIDSNTGNERFRIEPYTGYVGINKTIPNYLLDVNGTFNASGNSLIGGTLGVTGATTLTGTLTVNNATVLNESSGDYDTRIESDGNANMVFVDASTNRVGIGTATPSKTLDVVGTLGVSGVATFAGNTVIDGGLKAKILKESGTGGFFNQIPSDVVTYIFEYTGATTGGGSTDFLGSPSSHTNRIINIINVSDVDYYLGFMTNLPYIKTNTTISELDYGQSMTVQSDGSKWWVISRNF